MSLPSTSYLSPTVGTGPATPSGSTASSTTDLPRPSKRALRPTLSDSFGVTGAGTSALTSSEIAAAKYGVDDETTRHLAAMAMRVRQRVTEGYQHTNAYASSSTSGTAFPPRTFHRSHSFAPSSSSSSAAPRFLTASEALALAKHDHELGQKFEAELAEMARRLKPEGPLRRMGEVGVDGKEELNAMDTDVSFLPTGSLERNRQPSPDPGHGRGKKRGQTEEEEDAGEATDVEDDDEAPANTDFDARPSFLRPYGAIGAGDLSSPVPPLRQLLPGGRRQTMLRPTKSLPAPRSSRQRTAALAGWNNDEDDAMDGGGEEDASDLSRWVGRTDF